MRRSSLALALITLFGSSLGLAACGDTWEGIKQDTSDNVEATGEVMEDLGEETQDAAN